MAKSPLGKILSKELRGKSEVPLISVSSYDSCLEKEIINETIDAREFWLGAKRFCQSGEAASPTIISAILVKKRENFPVIEAMEKFDNRVKMENQEFS